MKDLYKVLQVPRTATTHEIKTAYRKLALLFHPDRHDGDEVKVQAFKEASEAYAILIDTSQRRKYDRAKFGHMYDFGGDSDWFANDDTKGRKPPRNYRKVYAPHPPPNGKWHDAQRHYDMHYGDGMYREELKRAQDRARTQGLYEYHSPLGKGFTFGNLDDHNNNHNSNNNDNSKTNSSDNPYGGNPYFRNPYSKAEQGPPAPPVWLYEEGYISEAKTVLRRKGDVSERLHKRRAARRERQEQEQQEAWMNHPGQYQAFNQAASSSSSSRGSGGGCSIM